MSFRDDSTGIASADDMRDSMTGNNAPASPFDGYDDPSEMPASEIMAIRARELARERADTGEYVVALTERFQQDHQQGRVA